MVTSCLCSSGVNSRVADVEVLYNFVSSDHKPLIFKIDCVSHAAVKSNFEENVMLSKVLLLTGLTWMK